MIWGQINKVEPPYTIRAMGSRGLANDIQDTIAVVKTALEKDRVEFMKRRNRDVEVAVEIVS